jgi:precorrin-2 dehydrogenase/sirohydrochlorin ferrochelatase
MRYYPINLDVQNRECLVVGGGGVGERRSISLKTREYERSDMQGKFLVIGATDNEEVNETISKDAAERGLLCNIADRPAACNFVLPAIARQGDLLIAMLWQGGYARTWNRNSGRNMGCC